MQDSQSTLLHRNVTIFVSSMRVSGATMNDGLLPKLGLQMAELKAVRESYLNLDSSP